MTNLTLSSHFKLVIYSIHKEEVYRHALAFVDTVEPTARGGLATSYHNQAGESLMTLNEVVEAILDGNLASPHRPSTERIVPSHRVGPVV